MRHRRRPPRAVRAGHRPRRRRRPAGRRLPRRRARRGVRHAADGGRRGPPARDGPRLAGRPRGALPRLAGHVRVEGVPVHGRLPADGGGGRRHRRGRRRRAGAGAGRRRRSGADPPARQRQDRRRDRVPRTRPASGSWWSTTSTISTGSSASSRASRACSCASRRASRARRTPRSAPAGWTPSSGSRSTRPPRRCAAPAAHPLLRVDGVHIHIGSQILEAAPFAESVRTLAALLDAEGLGPFAVYDLGGGLGVRYTYDDAPGVRSSRTSTPSRVPPASCCRPARGCSSSRAARSVARSAATDLPRRDAQAHGPGLRRRRRRHGRQPRGGAVRAALRGRPRGAAARARTPSLRPGRPPLRVG